MSLRGRILALGVGAAAAMLVLLSVPVVLAVVDAARTDAERQAASVTQGVADLVSTGRADGDDLTAVVSRANERSDDVRLGLTLADGTGIGPQDAVCGPGDDGFSPLDPAATSAPRDDADDRPAGPSLGRVSPVEVAGTGAGRLARVIVQTDDGPVAVCALVPSGQVREEVLERTGFLGVAGLGILVAVGVGAVVLGRRLAGRLGVTAATADRLAAGDLSARAPEDGPEEIRSVGAALNRLAGRIEELLTLERETVADLSHRLRTPLMAVRLDVEALPDGPARTELEEHLAQLERTLTAVIRAARRPQREGVVAACAVGEVVRDRFDFWAPLLEDQARSSELDPGEVTADDEVRCAADDLAAALDALLENVVAHTPEGTAVSVVVRPSGASVAVEVRDLGEGVPHGALRRGQSDRGSTGLGLDIARGCAEASGGRIELDRHDGWSIVRLVLGRA